MRFAILGLIQLLTSFASATVTVGSGLQKFDVTQVNRSIKITAADDCVSFVRESNTLSFDTGVWFCLVRSASFIKNTDQVVFDNLHQWNMSGDAQNENCEVDGYIGQLPRGFSNSDKGVVIKVRPSSGATMSKSIAKACLTNALQFLPEITATLLIRK